MPRRSRNSGHSAGNDELRSKTGGKSWPWPGDLIGLRWRQLVPEIDRLVSEEKGVTNIRKIQEGLIKADRLGRQVDGGSTGARGIVHRSNGPAPRDPRP